MGSRILCIAFLLFSVLTSPAQELRWSVGMDYFFDNMEYKPSQYADARTLQGIWFNALGGVSWDSTNTLVAGVNLLKMPGMNHAIDKAEVTLYYNYENEKVQFRAGAFPRREVLSNYSDFFFRDSVNQFMPLMQGIFWQLGKENNFVNAWMDWTGYSTAEKRESFFLGLSGKTSKGLFFADFQSSLFHLAGNYPNDGRFGVSEVIQGIASVGLEYLQLLSETERQMKPIDRLVLPLYSMPNIWVSVPRTCSMLETLVCDFSRDMAASSIGAIHTCREAAIYKANGTSALLIRSERSYDSTATCISAKARCSSNRHWHSR